MKIGALQKRLIIFMGAAALISVLVLMGAMPANAAVATVASGYCGEVGDNVTWKLDEDGLLTIDGEGNMEDFPSSSYVPWIDYRDDIYEVKVRYGVTSVGGCAFGGCTNLSDITLASTVSYIGHYAFGATRIYSIDIPNAVTEIGYSAFYNCKNLTSVTIPNGVTTLGQTMFSGCNELSRITLPESLVTIGWRAFDKCDSLSTVTFKGTQNQWNSINIDSSGNEDLKYAALKLDPTPTSLTVKSYPAKTSYNVGEAFSTEGLVLTATYGDGTSEDVSYGYTVSGFNSKKIGIHKVTVSYRNKHCYIDVSVSASGVCGENAFWTLDGSGTLTVYGSGPMPSFGFCDQPWADYSLNITKVVIENGITSIGSEAFSSLYENLTEAIIGRDVTYIGEHAFDTCRSLERVNIPSGVTYIGKYAFQDCPALTEINIPAACSTIGDYAFDGCTAIKGIWVDEGNMSYASDAQGVLFNKEMTKLIQAHESLEGIYAVPNGVLTLAGYSFHTSRSMHSIFIPKTVTRIAYDAFGDYSDELVIYYGGSEEQWAKLSDTMYNDRIKNATVYYSSCIGVAEHSFEWVVDTESSCGADGEKHEECSVCHSTRNENTIIPATGEHSFKWVIDTNNTCGEDGKKHEECSVCHATRNENTLIPATGEHSFKWVIDTNNTCGADGIKHEECSVCHATRSENTVIPATGMHDYDNDCDAECNVCHITREIHHDFQWFTDELDCISGGIKHEECTICHTTQNENTVIDAIGYHDFSSGTDSICDLCGHIRWVLSIELIKAPHKLTYFKGDTYVNVTGGRIKIFYNDGTTGESDVTVDMIYNFDCSQLGPYTVMVVYEGQIATYSIKILLGGSCGTNLTWMLDENGTLTVSGTGAMTNYSSYTATPWYNDRASIKKLIVEDGVTTIGKYAFSFCDSMTYVQLSETVKTIEYCAFYSCGHIKSARFPKSLTTIGEMGVYGWVAIENIWYTGTTSDRSLRLSIGSYNNWVVDAKWHYNTCPEEHTYTSDCDGQCDKCDWTRYASASHTYTASCDTSCNICSHTRTTYTQHTYSSSCDKTCNVCDEIRYTITHTYTDDCDDVCNVCRYERTAPHGFQWIIDKENNCGDIGIKHEECSYCHIKRNENTTIAATGSHRFDNADDTDCNVCNHLFVIIKFDANGGTSLSRVRVPQNYSISLSLYTTTRRGYNFAGWATSRSGDATYSSSDSFHSESSVTLYAQWNKICTTCSGSGKKSCSDCSGSGKEGYRATCTTCSGGMYMCSRCNKWLYLTDEEIRDRYYFEDYNAGGIWDGSHSFGARCPYCNAFGTIGEDARYVFMSCSTCYGTGTITKYDDCYWCSGSGKTRCNSCNGSGEVIRRTVSTPSAPTVARVTADSIELKAITGGEYSLDGIIWQDSPTFEGLESGKAYTFYQRYAKTDTTYASSVSKALTVIAHDHTYDNDCDAECNVCLEKRTVGEHVKEYIFGYDPTCTEEGLTDCIRCTVCRKIIYDHQPIAPLGHNTVVDHAIDPTCIYTGLTEGSHCSTCGEVFVPQETIDALGHSYVVDSPVDPTCTQTGLTSGIHCERCNAVIRAQETVPSLGHTPVTDNAVDPTCTESGLTEGSHCGACGAIIREQRPIEALGHSPVVDEATKATCTAPALTAGIHCELCNEIFLKQEITEEPLGHSFSEEYTVDREPAGGIDGEKSRHCTRDGCTERTDVTSIPCTFTAVINGTESEVTAGTRVTVTTEIFELTDAGGYAFDYWIVESGNTSLELDKEVRENFILMPYGDVRIRSVKYLIGDVNRDGKVNARDKAALTELIKSGAEASKYADIDLTGRANARDKASLTSIIKGSYDYAPYKEKQ